MLPTDGPIRSLDAHLAPGGSRFAAPPTPIAVPTNHNAPRPVVNRPVNEFDLHAATDNTVEYTLSKEDTEKALQDLMSDVGSSIEHEVDMSEAIVPGFKDGIKLMPHQIIGRKWMAERESGKRTGGILADDMGLGKTIQTITRIVEGRIDSAGRKAGFAKTTLVICPVAVVSQWGAEIKKMAQGLKVIEHHGQNRTTDPDVLKAADVVITSYTTVASEHGVYAPDTKDEGKGKGKGKAAKSVEESDDDDDDSENEFARYLQRKKKPAGRAMKKKDAIFRVHWWRIVLDEAHNIKNRATKSAQACHALEAKYHWCLTGTPMQNNVEELYSLLKFLRIRPLDDWNEFKVAIAQPIKNGRPQRAIKRLHVVLNACMLRRTKTTLLNGKPLIDLPGRIVNTVECKFDPEELHFYESLENLVQERLKMLQRQGDMGKNYTCMLVLLLRLRQACNHPSLVSQDYRKDKEAVEPKAAKDEKDIDEDADELADLMGGMGLMGATKRCQMCQKALTASNKSSADDDHCVSCEELMAKARRKSVGGNANLPPTSAKIRKILDLLDEIDERDDEEKTIIFSQFTSMLDLIEPFLKAQGIKYVRYDGSMSKPDREEALRRIKTSASTRVILISFKAGSTGLNLTCCNNVILVDLWWNPALEDQAFDRAHRLGQTRPVHIHKLSVPGTVEQRILELQEKKRALAAAALSGDKMKSMKLGMDDLMALFKHGGRDDDESDED
ncbi:DEAD/DEAH box helicase [Phanerochaete sordida]|uniref:DEAD/DEAH box helicase n=1 Tax=Phanerochaete sordida TaxID=48140 RepID=A0A9P3LKL7_9APHY|nr:DEAD/DEAH box helicase [Phanerochaete sordida]